jgi:CheY-like chemotaxis protein
LSSKPQDPNGPTRRGSGTRRKPPLVLLVDDNPECREIYRQVLRSGGYRTVEAPDGEAALALAFADRPDIVVMDLCMPRMDGWEAIRRLKEDPRTRTVPIVVLTAIGWNTRAVELHCEAYLIKPCSPPDLLGVLDALAMNGAQARS